MTPLGQLQHFERCFEQTPVSTWWVRPPHCGSNWLVQELRKVFDRKGEDLRVAHLRPDSTRDAQQFVDRIGRLWNVREERPDDPPPDRLADMVQHVREQGATPLLFVSRFHTMANWLDLALLGMMRDLEQDRELLSCIVAPLPPEALKRWLRSDDVVFAQSDYGDGHDIYSAVIPPESEMEALYLRQGGSRDSWPHILALSGGIPAFVDMAGSFSTAYTTGLGRSQIQHRHREELRTRLHELCSRFFRYLDEPGSTAVAEALVSQLLLTSDDPTLLLQHPWREVLLNERMEIRARTLGEAAIEHVGAGKPYVRDEYRRRCYAKGLYQEALDAVPESASVASTLKGVTERTVLEVTARMIGVSTAVPYIDTRWAGVASCAEGARKAVKRAGDGLLNGQELLRRLDHICDLAPRIARFTSGGLGEPLLARIKEPDDFLGACAWLSARFKAASNAPGPTHQLMLMDSLPETIVRLWLCSALGDRKVPELPEDRIQEWWSGRTPFKAPCQEAVLDRLDYTSMAMVAAVWGSVELEDTRRLFRSPIELDRCLRINEQLRNPMSHEAGQAQSKDARNFLDHCHFHLERFVEATVGYESLDDAIEALAPLPFPLFDVRGD